MEPLKAIETIYKGYKFRSRLEARWAVFFDTLGIRYEYEKGGFELPIGRYLPDFYLRDLKLWVEVKPGEPTEEADTKARQLAAGSQELVLLVCIPPWQIGTTEDEPNAKNYLYHPAGDRLESWYFVSCAACDKPTIGPQANRQYCLCDCLDRINEIAEHVTVEEADLWFKPHLAQLIRGLKWAYSAYGLSPLVEAAGLVAKQARFEFGQKG